MWLAVEVKALDDHLSCARHESHESGKAQTSFEEFNGRIADRPDLGIDDYVERYWPALPLGEFFLRQIAMIFREIFDDRELDRHADLRRGAAEQLTQGPGSEGLLGL